MVKLQRTVRFAINPGGSTHGSNGDGGVPAFTGLARHYALDVVCRGEPDPSTGYLINIKAIDHAVRDAVIPPIARACAERPETDPAALLFELTAPLRAALGVELASLRWHLTPSYSVEAVMPEQSPRRALVRQRFDLACAHRLHDPSKSDEDNRRLFGKCNNPSGHGHNYRVEPCVAIDVPKSGAAALSLTQIEDLVDRAIVEPFDHTHLNEDTHEFRSDGGLNPSVENIAKVFYERLGNTIRATTENAQLVSITVWETERTSCTYPG